MHLDGLRRPLLLHRTAIDQLRLSNDTIGSTIVANEAPPGTVAAARW
jgi:hypothetical protein